MIRLDNVSKFYYRKGMITSGISKVSLSLDIGEFVVITGESGSGKSTLINVISGVDSYEEGEMYVDGQETSHFSSEEFEDYRRRCIANIFQEFNLVSSYTVRQNVELILQVNGCSREEIDSRVTDIIERVGLAEYSSTRVSKLSGGQQQRVAIARALAKDTSIITADEPTGNLDSVSAAGIVALLHEIAKDKLVIVVTHNEEQFKEYATRIIKMSDGHVAEDLLLQTPEAEDRIHERDYGRIRPAVKLRIGVRNAFNIVPKFVLLLIVFLFIVFSVSSIYANLKTNSQARQAQGYNQYFTNYKDTRIVARNRDKSPLTRADYSRIKAVDGVKDLEKDDVLLDEMYYIENDSISVYGYPCSLSSLHGRLDIGTRPSDDSGVVLACAKSDLGENPESILGKTYTLQSDADTGAEEPMKVKIAGVRYTKSEAEAEGESDARIYLQEKQLASMRHAAYLRVSTVTTRAGTQSYRYTSAENMYPVVASSRVAAGGAMVPEELNGGYADGRARGKKLSIHVENMYFKKTCTLKAAGVYTGRSYKKLTGGQSMEESTSEIFINEKDYDKLFPHGNYQCSVYAADVHQVDRINRVLQKEGFKTLALKNALQGDQFGGVIDIIQVPLAILLLVAVFFISYFVIRLILRSRTSYFGILQMLGMARKDTRHLLEIELMTVAGIAGAVFLVLVHLLDAGIVPGSYLQNLAGQLHLRDDLILLAMLAVIACLIAGRFSRALSRKSAMSNYREEA